MKGTVRLATLLAAIALIPSTSTAPVDPITALAPVEVWADGFGDLQGIAVDAEGAVYVADRLAGTVTRIAPDRSRTIVASGLDGPVGLAFESSGHLVVAEERAGRVTRIEHDGRHTAIISNVQQPRWLACGADGVVYVSTSDTVLRRAPSGELNTLADQFVGLQGLAVRGDVLYAAALGRAGRVLQGFGVYSMHLRPDGQVDSMTLIAGPNAVRALALVVDSRGAIFASTQEPVAGPSRAQRAVVKLRPDGGGQALFAAGLSDPAGLAFDPDGNLLLADGSAGRVLKFHAPKPPAFGAIPPYTNVSPLSVALAAEPGASVVVEGTATVVGTADAQGSVGVTVPLTPNAPTTLAAWAIGRGGDGLTSRAAEATVVHDNVAPTLDWPSPVSGTAAGASVAIRLRADDAVSGVASITVTVDGRPLSVISTPSLPGRSITAMATWDGVTDGVHTLNVIASDRAGNTATLSHSVVIGTSASPGQPAATLATSASTLNPADPPGFTLTLAPASASVLQGGGTSYRIEAGNGPARVGSARLSVDGLPSGVTAAFIPPQLVPGQAAQLLLRAARGAAIGAKAFTVRALGDGGQASSVTGTLTVLAGGRTALAGRVVDTDRQPLSRVSIIVDTVTVATDANGNFLMLDPPVGEQVVLIDGDPAGSAADRYPTIPVSMTIVANQLNELPYVPHLHKQHQRFTPIHPTQKTVATDPDLPGVALHLERGNDVIGWDGQRADKVSIRTVPADRLPVRPLPPGLRASSVYMFYFGKRGGGIPQQPVPFEAPNDLGLAPGEKATLWYFDESPRKGEAPNDWRIAGTGTVSADGRTIKTDPGVGIPKFCCGAAAWNPQETGSGQQPGPTSQGGNEVPGADPVDLATGIFTLRKTDLVLPGRMPVAITRSYRSGDTFPSAFGIGTRMGYDEFLQQTSATVITYVYSAGARTQFVQQADGSFTNAAVPAFRGVTIRINADSTRTLRFKDGRTVTFDSSGLQIARKDAAGNQVTILRTVETNPTTIQEPSGRALTVSWIIATRDRVSQVSDPLGRTVQYGYDTSNRLVTVTDPAGGVTQYGYDSAYRMTTVTDARGIVFLTNVYDSNSRVCRQTQADGGVYAMYYVTTDIATAPGSVQLLNEAAAGGPISQAPCTPMGSTSPVVATVLVDPRGHPTTYRFNGAGVLTSMTDALGQVTTYEREANTNLLLSVTDPLNRVTRSTYDAQGNVLTVTDPANNVRTLTYDATFNRVTTVRDPLNNTTVLAYDTVGNLTSMTDPLNHTTTVTYNAFGQPVTVTDPLNHTTTFTYDTNGNLATAADPLGNVTTYAYDMVSRRTSQSDPLGAGTTMAYDVRNRVTAIRDAKSGTTSFAYDANGNLLSLTDARGSTTTYTYNAMDRMATRTDPLGHSETFTYDLAGNLGQHTDRKGQLATFSYDALNRWTGATYADATVSHTLDVAGRLTQATDSIGGTITNAYDVLDQLSSQMTALGTVSYQYDVLGRRTQMTVPSQSPVTYAYDAASRLTAITQGANVVQFGYDAANRRTTVTLPNGITTQRGYDAASHLTALTYQLGTTTLGDLQYLSDAAGNRIQVGGSWARTGVPQAVPSATYNVNNQQQAFGSQSLTYDLNGNLTGDGANTYTWDARNRLAAITGPVSASFVYDTAGRRSRKIVNGASTDFVYDTLNPVQEQSGSVITNLLTGLGLDEYFSRGDATTTEFFLTDALGSTIALADSSGSTLTSYTYEPFGATSTTGTPTSNPYDFTGRETDLTGVKYYRARYYNPAFARFLSPDPLLCGETMVPPLRSILRNPQLLNEFAYVTNAPLGLRDPLGLSPECDYYKTRCAEVINKTSKFYYCVAAPWVCERAGRGPIASCYRQCLQDFDRDFCVPRFGRKDRDGWTAACAEVAGHAGCIFGCVVDLGPPGPPL